jgi:hypothetical protein
LAISVRNSLEEPLEISFSREDSAADANVTEPDPLAASCFDASAAPAPNCASGRAAGRHSRRFAQRDMNFS